MTDIEPNGPASPAGLRVGDVITRIDGQPTLSSPLGDVAGKEVKLAVDREGKEVELSMKVGSREFIAYTLAEIPGATPQQLRIREGWLKR